MHIGNCTKACSRESNMMMDVFNVITYPKVSHWRKFLICIHIWLPWYLWWVWSSDNYFSALFCINTQFQGQTWMVSMYYYLYFLFLSLPKGSTYQLGFFSNLANVRQNDTFFIYMYMHLVKFQWLFWPIS